MPSYYIRHAHNRVSVRVCTVTEEEKTALKAQLPYCSIYGFDGSYYNPF